MIDKPDIYQLEVMSDNGQYQRMAVNDSEGIIMLQFEMLKTRGKTCRVIRVHYEQWAAFDGRF